jgi:hypothetical protein
MAIGTVTTVTAKLRFDRKSITLTPHNAVAAIKASVALRRGPTGWVSGDVTKPEEIPASARGPPDEPHGEPVPVSDERLPKPPS